jgi:hypothetical protein
VLSNHRVVLPWCTQDLGFIELEEGDVISQSFNVSLSVLDFVSNLL